MKFLIVAPRFHTNLYYRAKALQDAGHSVKVVVMYKGKSEYYADIDFRQIKLSFFSNLLIKLISIFKTTNLISGFEMRVQSPGKELKKLIQTYKPDVIILKAYQNILAVKTLMIAKKYKIKVLMLTQTNFTHIKGSQFLFKINIKLFKFLKVHSYITPIQSNFEAFKNFGIENVFYLPFVFPQNNNVKINIQEKIKIISIGKYTKRKDQILLLQAINILIQKGFHISLNLFGELADDLYYQTLNKYVKDHKLEANIHIHTNMTYADIQNEYRKHHIFVLPSYAEPAAYSIVEAMANSLPVICSTENGTECYIEEGKTGFVFTAKNLNDLVDKISVIISDTEKLKEMSKNCLISAKENHNMNKFAVDIIEIIGLNIHA